MSDPVDSADTKKPLTPANQNPWYVLMTLYGEQEGEVIDRELHAKNRATWNAWAGQAMDEAEKKEMAAESPWVTVEDLDAWPNLGGKLETLHKKEWHARNPEGPDWPGLPDPHKGLDCSGLAFTRALAAQNFVFPRLVRFTDAAFSRAAWFGHANFTKEAWFDGVIVDKEAWFSFTTFKGEAWYLSATFNGRASFSQTKFKGDAWFTFATFSGLTYFRDAHFGKASEDQEVNFRDCVFSKATSFRGTYFLATCPDFQGAALHPETTFTAKAGDADGPFWPTAPADPVSAKESCAKIRNNLGKQGFPEDEHFFYRKEMRFAGMAAANPVEKLAYWLFGALSDYGYSFVRPVVALAAVFGLGFAAYWGFFLQGSVETPLGTALGLSISNLFPYFGFARFFDPKFAVELPPVLKALGGFQTVSGAVLLFLFALGLRTRFRMR